MRFPRTYYRFAFLLATFISFAFLLHMIMPPSMLTLKDSTKQDAPQPEDPETKIDWHNYSQIQADKRRTGLGEHGAGVHLANLGNNPQEEKLQKKLFRANGFNAYISDKISLHRALPDIRTKQCRFLKYRKKLPTASIVIPFHQEHLSTLKRTFISVLERAPAQLVKEVILVDDASTKEFLKSELEDFLKNYPKVRLIRLKSRAGLVRARLAGAEQANGDVIIFLDSHCETNVNWLPPLLDPIAEDYRTVVCPFIDVISDNDFAYLHQDEGMRGAFSWQLLYKRLPRLPEDKRHPERPFASPVMAGGLFAMSKRWFWELGGYDKGLEIWGGEQYELSFKIWMCGGRMVDAPCSRIGHVYRKFMPFTSNIHHNYVDRNHKRVVETWMDEYKEYVYKRNPSMRTMDAGDFSEMKNLRKRLGCKSFAWFMKNVAFDLPKWYPPVTHDIANGTLRCEAARDLCVDMKFGSQNTRVVMATCSKKSEQSLFYHWNGAISSQLRSIMCLDGHAVSDEAIIPVLLFGCHNQRGNQMFVYDMISKQLQHKSTGTCLACIPSRREVELVSCQDDPQQQWRWESKVSEQAIRELRKIE